MNEAGADQRRAIAVRLPQRLAAARDRGSLLLLSAHLIRKAENRQDQPAQRVLRHIVEQRQRALERLA